MRSTRFVVRGFDRVRVRVRVRVLVSVLVFVFVLGPVFVFGAGCAAGQVANGVPNDGGVTTDGPLPAPAPSPGPAPMQMGGGGSKLTGLPSHLAIGLSENLGGTWLRDSGVKWDLRYAYFTAAGNLAMDAPGGPSVRTSWLHRWGYQGNPASDPDGQAALDYMRECDQMGFIPVIQYYLIRDYSNGALSYGNEAQTLLKIQNPAIMSDYWSEFRVMMQMAAKFGKPVVLILEGDGFGFLEQQSHDQPGTAAAVASTGMAELAGLPNTVAGFGQAFLQLRKQAGASNALLGIDVPEWATGDLAYYAFDDLQPHIDQQYAFLAPLGLAANQTGATFDFVAADPLDADSDYYTAKSGENRWWDASDSAPVNTKSFNRYAAWLSGFHQKSNKPWILWQIPIGNSASLNVDNPDDLAGQLAHPGAGYKDNRAEYLLGPSSLAHLTRFTQAGVVALLFGAGEPGVANYTNDVYTDGKLFLKSRAGALLAAGGFPLP